jgi:ABC-2 type transport system ATP-binding protein
VPKAVDALVVLRQISKVYEPTPRWMRPFVRTHIRHTVQALDRVDLTLCSGEICAVVGPNGAGKTTLFRIIVGLTTPSNGQGTVLGLDVEHESEKVRQAIGWMPAEDRSLLMRATCKENLELHGRLQGMSRAGLRGEIDVMLETVGIATQRDAIVASLSAGMKARLRLARALLPGPRVLLLDEPTGAIDPIAAHSLLRLITEITRRDRLAVLLSSHRLEEIEALSSRALLLDGGRVRYSGDLDQLREQFNTPEIELTFGSSEAADRVWTRLERACIVARLDGRVVRCRPPSHVDEGSALGAVLRRVGASGREDLQRVREIPLPLRDLIAHVYARDAAPEEDRAS